MKRIIILCDGTWNRADAQSPTNVVRMAQCIKPTGDDGISQFVIYIQGVGTQQGATALTRMIDRFAGGALGLGLSNNVLEAYRSLMFCYEPDDEIFIMGFSRGAYTARSLVGLIRSAGIASVSKLDELPKIMARYRSRETITDPTTIDSFTFRRRISQEVTTSQEELVWRAEQYGEQKQVLSIAYLGIWDTVGAMGLPGFLGWVAHIFNKGYRFHDTKLSRLVSSARHAVAIDERRRFYPPTLWDEMNDMNGEATGNERPYIQEWFSGNHGSVGGGGEIRGLSSITFDWVAAGAMNAGLDLRKDLLQNIQNERVAVAPLHPRLPMKGVLGAVGRAIMFFFLTDREGPKQVGEVSDWVRWRTLEDDSYRPNTLDNVMGDLLD